MNDVVHPDFIVNLGGATADDVYDLIAEAQAKVRRQSGVWLRPEVQFVGRWSAQQRRALDGPTG